MSTKVKDLQTEGSPALTDYVISERIGGPGIQPRKTLLQKVYDLFVSSGIGEFTVADGIAAAGTVQGDATPITKTRNRVDTVAPGTGVVEDATAPKTRTVQANGANNLKWYPNGTDQFYVTGGTGLLGAGIPVTVGPGNSLSYVRYSAGVLTIQG